MKFSQEKIKLRFDELIQSADDVWNETHEKMGEISPINIAKLRASARHLLTLLLPGSRVYLEEWDQQRPINAGWYKGILLAAREDYLQGLIEDPRTFISAEVFDDFLDQAKHLLDEGYKDPAAVIAGSVLEDGLRKLCDLLKEDYGKKDSINLLNQKLYKLKAYNKLWFEEISAKAVVRNHAAHGKYAEYRSEDVRNLIDFTNRFLLEFLRPTG